MGRPLGLALLMATTALAIPLVFVARVAMIPIKGLGAPR